MGEAGKPILKPSDLTQEILSNKIKLDSFCCGDPEYDDFIRNHAHNHQNKFLGTTYVFFSGDKAVGFVTIAMGHLKKQRSEKLKDTQPLRNIPCLFLAQMARDKSTECQRMGDIMIEWVIGKATKIAVSVACRFVLLECDDHNIKTYKRNGFELLPKCKKDKRNYMIYDLLR